MNRIDGWRTAQPIPTDGAHSMAKARRSQVTDLHRTRATDRTRDLSVSGVHRLRKFSGHQFRFRHRNGLIASTVLQQWTKHGRLDALPCMADFSNAYTASETYFVDVEIAPAKRWMFVYVKADSGGDGIRKRNFFRTRTEAIPAGQAYLSDISPGLDDRAKAVSHG